LILSIRGERILDQSLVPMLKKSASRAEVVDGQRSAGCLDHRSDEGSRIMCLALCGELGAHFATDGAGFSSSVTRR
jgi:hypothetical protein